MRQAIKKVARQLKKWTISYLKRESIGSDLSLLNRRSIALMQRKSALTKEEISNIVSSWKQFPVFSIIMPVYDPPAHIFEQALDSVLAQAYPHWELCLANDASTQADIRPIIDKYQKLDPRIKVIHLAQNKGISGASNEALRLATGDFISLVDHDDLILHDTLFEVARRINENPDIDFVYTDSAVIDMHGNLVGYFFKPDFNWEMFLCHNWVGQLSTIRRSLVQQVGGWTEGTEGQDYDLFLRCLEQTDRISHIHKILYYWRKTPASIASAPENKPGTQRDQREVLKQHLAREKIEGTLSDIGNFMFRIHRPVQKRIRVTLIVYFSVPHPGPKFLENLTDYSSLFEIEILVLGSSGNDWKPGNTNFAVRFLDFNQSESLAANLNEAITESKGEYCFFVFGDFEGLDEDRLLNLVEQSQRQDAGLVAGKLLNSKNRIESAGVILSTLGPYDIYNGERYEAIGDSNSLISPRSYQLLSGNLSMISKTAFLQVGGFDVNFKAAYFDYDLCMRLEQCGFRNIYTPFTSLRLRSAHNFYNSNDHDQSDFVRFRNKWSSLFGRDGNLNFALQNALIENQAGQGSKTSPS